MIHQQATRKPIDGHHAALNVTVFYPFGVLDHGGAAAVGVQLDIADIQCDTFPEPDPGTSQQADNCPVSDRHATVAGGHQQRHQVLHSGSPAQRCATVGSRHPRSEVSGSVATPGSPVEQLTQPAQDIAPGVVRQWFAIIGRGSVQVAGEIGQQGFGDLVIMPVADILPPGNEPTNFCAVAGDGGGRQPLGTVIEPQANEAWQVTAVQCVGWWL